MSGVDVPGLDPRAPLVLDVHDLGRRPGAMRRLRLTVPAPASLAVAMARVEPGSPLALDLLLESVVDGVLVTGSATAEIQGECARCLDPVSWAERVEISELFAYPETDARGRELPQPDAEEPLPQVEGDLLDLEPTMRDALVVALPLAPLCDPDCPGLCSRCGVRLADHPDHAHPEADPRWAALTTLLSAPAPGRPHDEEED